VARGPKETGDKTEGKVEGSAVDHDVIRELAKLLAGS